MQREKGGEGVMNRGRQREAEMQRLIVECGRVLAVWMCQWDLQTMCLQHVQGHYEDSSDDVVLQVLRERRRGDREWCEGV